MQPHLLRLAPGWSFPSVKVVAGRHHAAISHSLSTRYMPGLIIDYRLGTGSAFFFFIIICDKEEINNVL